MPNSDQNFIDSNSCRGSYYTMSSKKASIVMLAAADASRFGESINIVFRWKRSLYKMIWRHSLVFLVVYFSLTALYNFGLEKDNKKHFEALSAYFARYTRSFNWMIMLGFFTNTALHRLFTLQMTTPGTAKTTTIFIMSLKQDLPEGPDIVDQYARWVVLAWILTFRSVCKPLRDKFPNLTAIQTSGILLEEEKRILQRGGYPTPRPLIVIEWLLLLLKECVKEDRYINKSSHNKNVEAVMTFKKGCSNIIKFSTQNIPYAVIQAVIIVVYCFGVVTAMARNLPKFDNEIVRHVIGYFPVMPYIQFFVFIAWLSVGRAAVNPFGNDDTDIDVRKLCEAHMQDLNWLTELYTKKLDDVFYNLPQKQFRSNNQEQPSKLPFLETAC
ncbi:bestrophin-6-like isoform X2 [Daphnia pulex]|uniref:bestrophin-6-like isoform X2 n=1 Tax=Daphnia pulex TaxID=6669 RepID=UPI001EDF0364|nr:bestrophin-6-like isoform X2 [Daphnia pulex]